MLRAALLAVLLAILLAGTVRVVYAVVEVQKPLAAVVVVIPNSPPAIAGDVDANGIVDLNDLRLTASSFGVKNPGYAYSDVNGDGIVDIYDLVQVGINYGKTGP